MLPPLQKSQLHPEESIPSREKTEQDIDTPSGGIRGDAEGEKGLEGGVRLASRLWGTVGWRCDSKVGTKPRGEFSAGASGRDVIETTWKEPWGFRGERVSGTGP